MIVEFDAATVVFCDDEQAANISTMAKNNAIHAERRVMRFIRSISFRILILISIAYK